jgi:hypothetical protein
MTMTRLLAAAAVLALAACSGHAGTTTTVTGGATAPASTGPPARGSYADIRALCLTALGGYTFTRDPDALDPYAAEQGTCGPNGSYDVYWFARPELRDKWLTVALSFGGAYVAGDRWVVQTDGLSDAHELQARIGGQVRS